MSARHSEAVQHLADAYSHLAFELISKPQHATGEILAALMPTDEQSLLQLASELGREVQEHPDAHPDQLFTLNMRLLAPDEEAPVAIGHNITRVVALSPDDRPGMRGNFSHADSQMVRDWIAGNTQPRLLFTAYPSFIDDVIDMQQEDKMLGQDQVRRLELFQQKMLNEAMAASMQSMSAQIGLIGALKNIGVHIDTYNKAAAKEESKTNGSLLQASQAIRQESRALADVLKKQTANASLPPHLRQMMAAGLKELRSIGTLAEKQAPKINATPKMTLAAAARLHAATQTKSPAAAFRAATSPTAGKPSALNRGVTAMSKGQLYKALAKAGIDKRPVLIRDAAGKTVSAAQSNIRAAAPGRPAIAPGNLQPGIAESVKLNIIPAIQRTMTSNHTAIASKVMFTLAASVVTPISAAALTPSISVAQSISTPTINHAAPSTIATAPSAPAQIVSVALGTQESKPEATAPIVPSVPSAQEQKTTEMKETTAPTVILTEAVPAALPAATQPPAGAPAFSQAAVNPTSDVQAAPTASATTTIAAAVAPVSAALDAPQIPAPTTTASTVTASLPVVATVNAVKSDVLIQRSSEASDTKQSLTEKTVSVGKETIHSSQAFIATIMQGPSLQDFLKQSGNAMKDIAKKWVQGAKGTCERCTTKTCATCPQMNMSAKQIAAAKAAINNG